MNLHIQKLAEQATIKTSYQYQTWGDRIATGHKEQFDKEKFAELIVRECARTAAYFSIENKRIHPDIDPREMPDANRMVYHATCQSVAEEIRLTFRS
tara:strand:+ start:193 stop:483 length:291 start_codon:yes stop_codon:yes gene_type:complete